MTFRRMWVNWGRIPLRCRSIPAYDNPMAKAHKFDLENPAPILDDEDEETLAAIDEAAGTPKLVASHHPRRPAKCLPSGLHTSLLEKSNERSFVKGRRRSILISWL